MLIIHKLHAWQRNKFPHLSGFISIIWSVNNKHIYLVMLFHRLNDIMYLRWYLGQTRVISERNTHTRTQREKLKLSWVYSCRTYIKGKWRVLLRVNQLGQFSRSCVFSSHNLLFKKLLNKDHFKYNGIYLQKLLSFCSTTTKKVKIMYHELYNW